jgi:hypothetical protein
MAHNQSIVRPYIDQLMQKKVWDPSLIKRIGDEFESRKALALAGAAGWHGSDDIQSMVGLEGRFLWSENPLEAAQATFTFAPGHEGYQGAYQLSRLGSTVESGVFYSVPNNPAMGWAAITLVPTGSSTPRTSVVAGMFTDNEWRIEVMLLNKLQPHGLVQPAFPVVRMP